MRRNTHPGMITCISGTGFVVMLFSLHLWKVRVTMAGGHVAYAAPRERFSELPEIEDITRAKYFGHMSWVSVHRWDVFRTGEW